MLEKQNASGVMIKTNPPDKYSLVMFNDEVTPLNIVIDTLTVVFGYREETALTLARKAESTGAVVIKQHVDREDCKTLIKAAAKIAPTLGIAMKKEKT